MAIFRLSISHSLPISRNGDKKFWKFRELEIRNPWVHFLYTCSSIDSDYLKLLDCDLTDHTFAIRLSESDKRRENILNRAKAILK